MRPYNISITGQFTQTSWGGSFTGTADSSHARLDCVSQGGNRVDPTFQSYEKVRTIFLRGSYRVFDKLYPEWDVVTSGVLGGSPPTTPRVPFSESVLNQALNNFYEKLRESNLDLAVSVAELDKTGKMIGQRVGDVLRLAATARSKALKRFARRRPSKRTDRRWDRDMANAWLELKYGWLPLLSDIHGVATFQSTKAKRFRVRGSARRRWSENMGWTPSIPYAKESNIPVLWLEMARLQCDLEVLNPVLVDTNRLTSLNPIGIAWELVPYSFVVDWFVDIGSYIKNVESSFGLGMRFIRGFRTQVTVRERRVANLKTTWYLDDRFGCEATGLSCYEKWSMKQRVVLTDLPVPQIPPFEPKLGWQRLLSGAALLTQIFSKPKR